MEDIIFKPIGIIRTPYQTIGDCPVQAYHGKGVKGQVELFPEYQEGLTDLEGFSHLILVWHFHQSSGYKLKTYPPGETQSHGIFATRCPARPNPIALTVVRLTEIDGVVLHIEDPDMVDGTPLLDIKPYLLPPDVLGKVKRGWLDKE